MFGKKMECNPFPHWKIGIFCGFIVLKNRGAKRRKVRMMRKARASFTVRARRIMVTLTLILGTKQIAVISAPYVKKMMGM